MLYRIKDRPVLMDWKHLEFLYVLDGGARVSNSEDLSQVAGDGNFGRVLRGRRILVGCGLCCMCAAGDSRSRDGNKSMESLQLRAVCEMRGWLRL